MLLVTCIFLIFYWIRIFLQRMWHKMRLVLEMCSLDDGNVVHAGDTRRTSPSDRGRWSSKYPRASATSRGRGMHLRGLHEEVSESHSLPFRVVIPTCIPVPIATYSHSVEFSKLNSRSVATHETLLRSTWYRNLQHFSFTLPYLPLRIYCTSSTTEFVLIFVTFISPVLMCFRFKTN